MTALSHHRIHAPLLDELSHRLVGAPFEVGARGPYSFYCLGLWLYLLEQSTRIRLEDPFAGRDRSGILAFWAFFEEVKAPPYQLLDALYSRDGHDAHVSTIVSESGRVATTERPRGVQPGGVRLEELGVALQKAQSVYRLRVLA